MKPVHIIDIVRERGVPLPKGKTRVEIVIRPGTSEHFTLIWVEVDNRWQCYTDLPGVNNYGRVPGFDQIGQRDLFDSIQDILDECRKEDLEAQRDTLYAEHMNCDIDVQSTHWNCYHHNVFRVPL